MSKIIADPEQLISAGQRLTEIANEYQQVSKSILQTAEELSSAWQGKDNQTFAAKVQALEGPFNDMYLCLEGSGNDLTEDGQRYQQTQDEVTSRAQSLQSSIS